MALKAVVRTIVCSASMFYATIASGQSIAVDWDQSAGYSTENVSAVQTKLRASGGVTPEVRFNITGVWGKQSEESDAFAAAYPYTEHPVVLDAYVERTFRPAGRLFGVRLGRYRTPFGISSESDQGYVGFQRDPLIRYDDCFALSNTFFEHGADIIVGWPRLSVEVSVGASRDVGEHTRSAGLNTVVRGQAAAGSVIVGMSYIDTQSHLSRAEPELALNIDAGADASPALAPEQEHPSAQGSARFGGIDVRWMRGGVQLRGEFVTGDPFDGARTHGGYIDLIVHRPIMGPVTAALRAEHITHTDRSIAVLHGERYTAATRVRLVHGFIAQVQIVHNSQTLPQRRPTAVDIGVFHSLRFN
jgi:hypothetical protein